jgi:predicted dehydrogenase
LYDYASHPINLVNWFFGVPSQISGSVLGRVFSTETEDEVYSTFHYDSGVSIQLSVNWSDESERKMSTRLTLFGAQGKIYVDRQEIRVYLRRDRSDLGDYSQGWNLKYTTELTRPVRFYLRGEEYTAQLDAFVSAVRGNNAPIVNPFRDALETDMTMALLSSQSAEKMHIEALDTEPRTKRIIRARTQPLVDLSKRLVAVTGRRNWFRRK